jgi:hypothetical protein
VSNLPHMKASMVLGNDRFCSRVSKTFTAAFVFPRVAIEYPIAAIIIMPIKPWCKRFSFISNLYKDLELSNSAKQVRQLNAFAGCYHYTKNNCIAIILSELVLFAISKNNCNVIILYGEFYPVLDTAIFVPTILIKLLLQHYNECIKLVCY